MWHSDGSFFFAMSKPVWMLAHLLMFSKLVLSLLVKSFRPLAIIPPISRICSTKAWSMGDKPSPHNHPSLSMPNAIFVSLLPLADPHPTSQPHSSCTVWAPLDSPQPFRSTPQCYGSGSHNGANRLVPTAREERAHAMHRLVEGMAKNMGIAGS